MTKLETIACYLYVSCVVVALDTDKSQVAISYHQTHRMINKTFGTEPEMLSIYQSIYTVGAQEIELMQMLILKY